VHVGKHAAAANAFVRGNLALLRHVPSAFMSVSLSASEVDRTRAQSYVNQFLEQTDWQPDLTATIAGAIRYTSYNFLKKLVIKKIAEENGLPTDTRRDYEFTDWDEVTGFVHALEGLLYSNVPPAA
jgi:menaquinone-dependent protoporphyrinogen oxidase